MGMASESRARRRRPGLSPAPDLDLELDVFQGPFDLLITLVLKEEIDLWEVQVSHIIAEYVLRLADSEEFDLEATSRFIVLVASLLEMKSRLLLSDDLFGDADDELDEEAGEELLAALARYMQFKRAGAALAGLYARHAGRLYRQAPLPPRYLRGEACAGALAPQRLVAALAPLLREPPVPDVSHITDLAVSLVKELRRLRGLLDRRGSFTFAAVAPRDRLQKAVTFFALLELHTRGEVTLAQVHPFADIVVAPLGVDRAHEGKAEYAPPRALGAVG